VLIEQNEERESGMLTRTALHQEDVICNEQLNRQRVEAGQSAPIFSVITCICHYISITHLYIFVVFFVKLPA
jgi:hypothetical protein